MDYVQFALVLVAMSSLIHGIDGFGKGAPHSLCYSRYPKHGKPRTSRQLTDSPFLVSTSPTEYTPGNELTVSISSGNGKTFKGFMVGAFRGNEHPGVTEEIVGEFTSLEPSDKVKNFTCFPGSNPNMATHKNNAPVSTVTLKWKAPSQNVGNLTFIATIVEEFSTFWTEVHTRLPVSGSVTEPVVEPAHKSAQSGPIVKDVDFLGCGQTSTCQFVPNNCRGAGCDVGVSFTYRETSDDFVVEMVSNKPADYVSLAFSEDKQMGGDSTVSCVSQGGEMSVQHGLNAPGGKYNELLLNRYLTGQEISQSDGRIQCRFTLPRLTSVYKGSVPVDLSNSWYLHVAWGPTLPHSNVMNKHVEAPVVSVDRVDLRRAAIIAGSSMPANVRSHGCLMLTSWMLLAGLVTVLSRHFKDWLPASTLCGARLWFQLHRGLATLVLVFTAVGVVLVFDEFEWEVTAAAGPHAYVGIVVVVCLGLQVLGGIARPDKDHSLRPAFNWGHWFLGQATHALAGVAMFLAFEIEYLRPDVRSSGTSVLVVWVIMQVLWTVGFEIYSRRHKAQSSRYNVTEEVDLNMVDGEKGQGSMLSCDILTVMMAVYFACLLLLCISAMYVFLDN